MIVIKRIIPIIYYCSTLIALYMFCTEPVKPDFENMNPPQIGNGKQISRSGIPLYQKRFFLYINTTGSDSLTFHWFKNSTEIVEGTDDTLLFDTLDSSDSGIYYCIVTNDFGADTSLNDTLEVCYLPSILNDKKIISPGNPVIGEAYFMAITATGTEPLEYQWYKDGDSIIDTNNDSITFDTLVESDSGIYHCIVSNNFGSDTSFPDTLRYMSVNHPPKWSTDTMHCLAKEGDTFSVALTDSCSDQDNDTLTFILYNDTITTDTIIDTQYIAIPSYNDAGIQSIRIDAFDGIEYSSVILLLSISNTNRPPEFLDSLPDDNYHVEEGQQLIITFRAFDPDGDTIIYILAQNDLPGQYTFNDSQFVWQSTNNDSGYYNVTIQATDYSDTTSAIILVTVGNVNRPPVISIDTLNQGDTLSVKEGNTLSFTVNVTDPDTGNIPVLLQASNKPPGAQFDTSNGSFIYTPDFSVSTGINNLVFDSITFVATDNVNDMGKDTFVIKIEVIDSIVPVVLNTPSSTEITYNSVSLSWSISTDPDFIYYRVYHAFTTTIPGSGTPSAEITNPNTNSVTIGNLLPDTTYYFRVFVYNSITRTISGSNVVSAKTNPLGLPSVTITSPSLIGDSAAIDESNTIISGTASSDAGIDSVTAFFNGQTVKATLTDTTWNFSAASAVQGSWNAITMSAFDTEGNQRDVTIYIYYKPTLSIPSANKPLFIDTTRTSTDIEWRSVNYCTHYILYRSTQGVSGTFTPIITSSDTSHSDNNLDVFTRYWYKFKAFYTAPGGLNISDTTDFSTVDSVRTKPWMFEKSFGGLSADEGRSVKITTDNEYIIAGTSGSSAYMLKVSTGGDSLWGITYFQSQFNYGFDILELPGDGYVMTGYQESPSQGFLPHILSVKTDLNGTEEWRFYYFDWGEECYGYSITTTADNNYLIYCGSYYYPYYDNVYILKINPSDGSIANELIFDIDTTSERGLSIKRTNDGGFIVAGQMEGRNNAPDEILICKINQDATDTVWTNTIGGANELVAQSIIELSDGAGYALTGSLVLGTTTITNLLWMVLDNSGNVVNSDDFGETTDPDSGYCIIESMDENGNADGFVICGSTQSYGNGSDAYLIKVDYSGNRLWHKSYGGTGYQSAYSVQQTSDRGYIITGLTDNTSNSKNNVYLIKTDKDGNVE